jgi:hypothetical protein
MSFRKTCATLLALSTSCAAVAPSGPWDNFNIAPASKTLWPTAVKEIHGSVTNADNLVGQTSTSAATLQGESWVALDFGKEVRCYTYLASSFDPRHRSEDGSHSRSLQARPTRPSPSPSPNPPCSLVPSATTRPSHLPTNPTMAPSHCPPPSLRAHGRCPSKSCAADSATSLSYRPPRGAWKSQMYRWRLSLCRIGTI